MGRITASRETFETRSPLRLVLASKFINCLMHDGKKSTAQKRVLRRARYHQDKSAGRRADRCLHAGSGKREAVDRSPLEARRRCGLSGADAGESQPPAVVGHPLDSDRRSGEEGRGRRTKSWPRSLSPPSIAKGPRCPSAKTSIAWPTPTRPLPISPGRIAARLSGYGAIGQQQLVASLRAGRISSAAVMIRSPGIFWPVSSFLRPARRPD